MLSNRQTYGHEDFRLVMSHLGEIRKLLHDDPGKATEYAQVLLDDNERAAEAMVYIMRGAGANLSH